MVKGALLKKSLRDIRRSLSSFVCIFVMAMVSMSIVVGVDSIWKTMDVQSADMYRQTDIADLWISIPNPTEKDLWKIRHIDGVALVEKRYALDSAVKLPNDPSLKVYGMPRENQLDLPYHVEGNWTSKGGAVLDVNFAKAQGLSVGDDITVKINETWMTFPIEELALSSEHIFSIKDATTVLPKAEDYGFILVDEDKLKTAYGGMKVYNEVAIRLAPDADSAAVQKQIDSLLGDRMVGVITHNDHRSTKDVAVRISQLQILARVFPVMFFLVTALITLSTMSRLVEDQRGQIGILKALGYSRRAILWHYTSYGIYVGVLGILGGLIVGPQLIGRILVIMLSPIYTLPTYRLSLHWPNVLIGSVVVMLCTGGVSYHSSKKLMADKPAELLRDKPPKKGIHVLLEKFPAYWRRLKFRTKLIIRNTMRNRSRMFMAVLGVTGCAGLIISAFTLKGMIADITAVTYGQIYTYDHKAVLDEDTTKQDIYNLHLDAAVQEVYETAMQVESPDGTRKMMSVSVFDQEGGSLFHLQDVDGNPISFPADGVVLSRKMAESLGVEVGDSIRLKRRDDSYIEAPVKAVTYMVAAQGIYMSRAFWESMRETFSPSAVLLRWNREPDQSFLDGRYVEKAVGIEKQRADFEANLAIVDVAVTIMTVAGGVLAFVVLYNMGNLNFFERTRDLATLKVLGFNEKEIRSLVLVENVLSVAIGIVAGIPVGKLLSVILANGFGEDLDLLPVLTVQNVCISAVLTVLFALIVNRVVAHKMKRLDMLQALKSVE